MTVAKSLQHDAAFEHVSGSARYVDDIPTPSNTLHVAFGLSPIARGEIKSLDLSIKEKILDKPAIPIFKCISQKKITKNG